MYIEVFFNSCDIFFVNEVYVFFNEGYFILLFVFFKFRMILLLFIYLGINIIENSIYICRKLIFILFMVFNL